MASVMDSIVSFVDGRVRLRHASLKDKDTADMIRAVVGSVDGVISAETNPATGSLLVYYDPDRLGREQLLELAEQGMAFLPEAEGAERKEFSLRKSLFGREADLFVDRVLLASLVCCVGGAAAGMSQLHRVAGGIFTLASLQHIVAHRKALR